MILGGAADADEPIPPWTRATIPGRGVHAGRREPMDRETASVPGRGVHAAALAALPRAGPRRLHRLLTANNSEEAWQRVLSGSVPTGVADRELSRSWASHAAGVDLDELSRTLDELGVTVTTTSDPGHPARLADDIDPSPVIFRQGRSLDPSAPAVTIVGTRRCSPTGRSVAFELGSGLAEAGVTVVSGLALGIDGAAHRGALSVDGAPPVGVVGSGLNVVYPKGNSDLWRSVGDCGTLLSEAPPGRQARGLALPGAQSPASCSGRCGRGGGVETLGRIAAHRGRSSAARCCSDGGAGLGA